MQRIRAKLPNVPKPVKVGGAVVAAFMVGIGASAIGASPAAQQTKPDVPAPASQQEQQVKSAVTTESHTTSSNKPTVETKEESIELAIPYATSEVQDDTLQDGAKVIKTQGRSGVQTKTFKVTYTDGVETTRALIRDEQTVAPVTKVVAVGTKKTPDSQIPDNSTCDPDDGSACQSAATDVD